MKSLIASFFMPLPVAFLMMLTGGLLLLLGRKRSSWCLLGASVAVVFLSAWGPVADALLAPLERWHLPVIDVGVHQDVVAVVVLGSGYNGNVDLPVTSQLNDSAMVRLSEGIRLYRQIPEARLLLSGGKDAPQDGYARAAHALGVREDAMLHMGTVHDTAQEARAAHALLGDQASLFLVTSASHMARSVRHFERVGLNPIPAPTRHKSLRENKLRLDYWIPSAEHLRKTERALYEYMGMLSIELDH